MTKSKKIARQPALALRRRAPLLAQVERELARARAQLRAGATLRSVLDGLRRRAARGHLHPRTPEHVATVLRLDALSPITALLSVHHHDVLGLPADVGDPDQVDAACAEVLRLCRPSQFSSPALRRLMEEVCGRARDAREFLFFGEVEPGDGRRDGADEHDALVAALTAPLPPVAEPTATAPARAELGARSA
jgi:hypothetical protein